MSRLRHFLTDYRTLTALGLLLTGATLFLGVSGMKQAGIWILAAGAALALLWLAIWAIRKFRARRASAKLDDMMRDHADRAVAQAAPAARADTEVLREKMLNAVKAIKTSRLGQSKGSSALYELPWYVIIGNPAAGKSTAVLNSGLQFPFEDSRSNVIHGIGGTRNCDWYFTTEGIVLDTAGRYTVSAEDRLDWLTFLDLLRTNRPMAPINGVIIAASIAELTGSKPEFAIDLAKNLRQRVQELTERLEVFAPVYVVFTKADLIAGFSEFFSTLDPTERENGWGATLPYDAKGETDALTAFDAHFDILSDGLKEVALSQLSTRRGHESGPALLTLPLEFAAIKPALRTFIATLFEENPYQFKPVFRGFYFTSAIQEGASVHRASERISRQFDLGAAPSAPAQSASGPQTGFFLQGLFRKVIFADRRLVRQYSNPGRTRTRYAAFLGAAALLAVALAGWAWSYTANRQLTANVAADLAKAAEVQHGRVDLKSRIEALLILQQRLEQLEQYRKDKPLSLGLGLYQGRRIEDKVRHEYFNGMRQIMVLPTAQRLEAFLGEAVAGGARGNVKDAKDTKDTSDPAPEAGDTLYQEASPARADDAYAALKAYLMLGDRSHVEFSALSSELTRFWRGWLEANRGQMTREEMVRNAERLMTFYVSQSSAPDWPQIETKFALVDDARTLLREVMKGKPAVDRAYNDVKTRAATRFPTITADYLIGQDANKGAVTGNYAISGAFSRAAWEGYVKDAIAEAANKQLSTTDWVLETSAPTDLTIAGSPEHIAQELTGMYKSEYAREWRRFVDNVAIAEFPDFDEAVARMDSIGDARNSPLRKLISAINENTVWDNPVAESELMGKAREGIAGWFERVIMRRNPTSIPVRIDPQTGRQQPVPPGPIGQEFAGFARLMIERDGHPSMLAGYFEALGKIRTRLNGIRTQGAPGAGASKLMQDTLASGSELSEALKLVDEQMLDGVEDAQRQTLRNLLLRPLTQTYAALVGVTETEIDHVWSAQVQQPFESGIGQRYPFSAGASVEAVQSDIEQVFGPNGSIAQFSKDTLGSLVTRRGNALEPSRWADIGISLSQEFLSGYPSWVAPLGQAASAGGGSDGGPAQRLFRIQPQPVSGLNEYTIEIDGQVLRYRNTPPTWQDFRWPGSGTPGARISAVNASGQTIEVLSAPGSQGLGRLFEAAEQRTLSEGHYQLTWQAAGSPAITVELEVIAAPVGTGNDGGSAGGLTTSSMRGLRLPAKITATTAPATPAATPPAEVQP
ncbi:MAG: type VI secretion system membrane subunit TssM [Pseudoxanthomonas sp.]